MMDLIPGETVLAGINTTDPTGASYGPVKPHDHFLGRPESNTLLRCVRPMPKPIQEALDHSTLPIQVKPAFVHYWRPDITGTRDDYYYQLQAVFFWQAWEPFARRSLPPEFRSFERKYFLLSLSPWPENVHMLSVEVIPWFGQSGGGRRFAFYRGEPDNYLSIDEAANWGMIDYFEFVDLQSTPVACLTDRDNYYILNTPGTLVFKDGWPQMDGGILPISAAYQCGLLDVVHRVSAWPN